jgi:hypothetical protein
VVNETDFGLEKMKQGADDTTIELGTVSIDDLARETRLPAVDAY